MVVTPSAILAVVNMQTIRAIEVCCVDLADRDLEYNRQLNAQGGSWWGDIRRMVLAGRQLLFGINRSLVGGILICRVERQRRNKSEEESIKA